MDFVHESDLYIIVLAMSLFNKLWFLSMSLSKFFASKLLCPGHECRCGDRTLPPVTKCSSTDTKIKFKAHIKGLEIQFKLYSTSTEMARKMVRKHFQIFGTPPPQKKVVPNSLK